MYEELMLLHLNSVAAVTIRAHGLIAAEAAGPALIPGPRRELGQSPTCGAIVQTIGPDAQEQLLPNSHCAQRLNNIPGFHCGVENK